MTPRWSPGWWRSIRRTTPRIACTSSSPTTRAAPSTSRRCARSRASRSSPARRNPGFAANANRGLRAADPEHDVVLLNSDVVAAARLAGLPPARRQRRSRPRDRRRAKLLYPDNRIQFAGTIRNAERAGVVRSPLPRQAGRLGPRQRRRPDARRHRRLHVHHARACSTPSGCSTRRYGDGLRGRRLLPARVAGGLRGGLRAGRASCITTSPRPAGPSRANGSWRRSASSGSAGREFFDARRVARPRTAGSASSTSPRTPIVGGGHRDIFEHLNRLADRGHEVELWTLASRPTGSTLRCPVRTLR